ncbi:MAG: response regulator, partial [Candidatus Adiutrix sp.]|nr:response regulator [Candidatus Adiutrix sp.]
MARILLSLADKDMAARANSALGGGRFELTQLEARPEAVQAAAQAIIESRSDVAVIDFWPEDAASVKLMQTVSEIVSLNRPAFIFIEGSGPRAAREEVLMVLNEGAHAFLPDGFEPAALANYVERALLGPGRLRPRARDPHESDETIQILEEAMGQLRARSFASQKVIAHLLSTPFKDQNRKVLVVSDSSYQLEMLKKILEDHNFQVLTAGNPTDGLSAAMNEGPRIIVSDLELQGQTGVEFCQAVKFVHKIG